MLRSRCPVANTPCYSPKKSPSAHSQSKSSIRHRHRRCQAVWSGRRGSNPRPTAWKAVTLPLSYSRSDTSVVACPANPEWVVARGGFEPPKPLGRQIYSLLRLTAPQPRRLPALIRPPHTRHHPHTHRKAGRSLPKRRLELYWNSLRIVWMAPNSPCFAFVPLELAKGFEPPTR